MHRLREVLIISLLVAGCSSGAAELATPTATVQSSPTSAAFDTAAVRQQVEAAYLRSWDVYAKALRNLSTAGLEESFSGAALDSTVAEVNRLRARNTPVRMAVDHSIETTHISETMATVLDRYQNHAVLLDPVTGVPTEVDPNNARVFSYQLKKVGLSWLVIDITRF